MHEAEGSFPSAFFGGLHPGLLAVRRPRTAPGKQESAPGILIGSS